VLPPERTSGQVEPSSDGGDGAAIVVGGRVLSGGLWNLLARGLPQLYTLAISIAAARFLGLTDFGRQSFIAFVEISIVALISGGFTTSLTRYVGETLGRRRPGPLGPLMRWAWRIQMVGALLGGAILGGAALLGADPEAAWLIAGAVAIISALQAVPSAILIGAQRLKAASLVGLASGTIGTPATIAVLAAGGGIVGMFAVQAVVSAVNLILVGILARRMVLELAPLSEPADDLAHRVLKFSLFTTIGVTLTLIVWRRSEFLFLEHYSSDAEIGFYSIAFAVMTALILLPESITGAVSPAFASLHGAGATSRLRSGYSRAVRLLLLGSLPLTAAAMALGPSTLGLVYGSDFRATGPVLTLMLLSFPIVSLSSVSNALMLGLARVRIPMIVGISAASVTIGLNFLLVPALDALGAALANSGGQVAATLPILVYANREVGPVRWEAGSLLLTAVASAAGGAAAFAAVAFLGGVAGVALGLLAGAILFTGLAAAFRILPADDVAWAEQAIGGRLGTLVAATCRRFSARPTVTEGA